MRRSIINLCVLLSGLRATRFVVPFMISDLSNIFLSGLIHEPRFHSSKRKCFLAGCGTEIRIIIVIRLYGVGENLSCYMLEINAEKL